MREREIVIDRVTARCGCEYEWGVHYEQLRGEFEEAQLLDLFMPAGWYHAISFLANGAGVDLEAGAPRFEDY